MTHTDKATAAGKAVRLLLIVAMLVGVPAVLLAAGAGGALYWWIWLGVGTLVVLAMIPRSAMDRAQTVGWAVTRTFFCLAFVALVAFVVYALWS